jgi:pheromone shutdown protein TraB
VVPGTSTVYTDILPTLNITSVLTGVNVAIVKTARSMTSCGIFNALIRVKHRR